MNATTISPRQSLRSSSLWRPGRGPRRRRLQTPTAHRAEILELRVNLSVTSPLTSALLPIADTEFPSLPETPASAAATALASALPPASPQLPAELAASPIETVNVTEDHRSLSSDDAALAPEAVDDLLSQFAVSGWDQNAPAPSTAPHDPIAADLAAQGTAQTLSALASGLSGVSVRSDAAAARPAVQIHVGANAPLDAQTLQALDHPVRFQLADTHVVVARQDAHPEDTDTSLAHFRHATLADIALLNSLGFHVDPALLSTTDAHAAPPGGDHTPQVTTPQVIAANTRIATAERFVPPVALLTRFRPGDQETLAPPTDGRQTSQSERGQSERGQSAALPEPERVPGRTAQLSGDPVEGDAARPALSPEWPPSVSVLAGSLPPAPGLILSGDDLTVPLDVGLSDSHSLPVEYLQGLQSGSSAFTAESVAVSTFAVPTWALMKDRQPRTASMAFWLAAMTATGIAYRSGKLSRGKQARGTLAHGTAPATVAARFK